MAQVFDYVIVGGGTSGAIVARRLAEALDASVCLVEAGPSDEREELVLDYRNWPSMLGSKFDYDYAIEPQERGNSELRHARGRVLGGSSSANGAAAIIPHPYDFECWERAGASGWGPEETMPFFDRVLSRVNVEPAANENQCAVDFNESARALGFDEVDFNGGPFREGYGWCPVNARGYRRESSSVAYLHPLDRLPANLTVLTDVVARRLVIGDDGRASAVETSAGRLEATREIVLSCGTFDTPKLLLLSGIGSPDELRAVGIDSVVDLPGVGERLTDHPEGAVVWNSPRKVPGAEAGAWVNALFAATSPSLEAPDIMIHFGTEVYTAKEGTFGYAIPGAAPGQAFCMTPNVPRPRSEGRLWLRSSDPDVPPAIDPRYFTDPEDYDAQTLLQGVELARRIASTEPLASWVEEEIWPGERPEAELSEAIRRTAGTVFHPAGTCRMGAADDADAVVDPSLRVRGVAGLRIADASVFPTMVGVNPALTCMMVGERCADLIAAAS